MNSAENVMFFRVKRRIGIPDLIFRFACMLLLTCVTVQVIYGQNGFNRTYDTGVSLRFLTTVVSDNRIYIAGFYRREVSELQSGFIAALDTFGTIHWWTEIKDDSSAITMSEESGMLATGDRVIQPIAYFHRPSIGLTILDSTGNLISTHEYPMEPGSVTSPRDMVETADGYIITGWTSKPPLFVLDAFVLKTNFDGSQKWLRYAGVSVFEETARSISKVSTNEYVLSGTRYQWQQEPVFYHGWAYAIDSLGNKKWEWEASEEEVPHRGIMSMQYDSMKHEWVYVSFIEKAVFVPDLGRDVNLSVPVLVRRDSVMNLLSYTEYGPYSYNGYMGDLEKSIDGGYIAAGRITCLTEESPYNDCNVESGRVIKISANDTLEWSVIDTAFFHPELGSQSYLSGVTESPSGSVYAVGWANHYDENEVYRSFGWLLKITKDGCVDTLCTTTSLLEQIEKREKKIHVYPNPATDYLIFQIAEGLDVAHAEIYDLSGRKMQYQQMQSGTCVMMMEDGRYSFGMYVWRVVDASGVQVGVGKVFVE